MLYTDFKIIFTTIQKAITQCTIYYRLDFYYFDQHWIWNENEIALHNSNNKKKKIKNKEQCLVYLNINDCLCNRKHMFFNTIHFILFHSLIPASVLFHTSDWWLIFNFILKSRHLLVLTIGFNFILMICMYTIVESAIFRILKFLLNVIRFKSKYE